MKAIYKVHPRKNLWCKVKFSREDMLNLEHQLQCIPLCQKHKSYSPPADIGIPERELMTMYYECDECQKVYDKWESSVRKIYSQLCRKFYP